MEALRKIVPGSTLEPLFSLPRSPDELRCEVIVPRFDSGDKAGRESLTASLRGPLGDAGFDVPAS